MTKYFRRHLNSLKKSVKMKNFVKVTLLEIGKYLSILLSILLIAYIFARILLGMLPVYLSLEQVNDLGDAAQVDAALSQLLDQKYLLDIFMVRTIVLMLIFVVLLSLILAIFNILILDRLRGEKFQKRKFMKLTYIYLILTLIYFAITFIFIYKLVDVTAIAVMTIIFTLIYLYFIFIFKFSIHEGSIWKDVKHGLLNSIRLHDIFPAFLMCLLVLFGVLFICGLFVWIFGVYASIVLLIFVAAWSVWITNYHDHILNKEV